MVVGRDEVVDDTIVLLSLDEVDVIMLLELELERVLEVELVVVSPANGFVADMNCWAPAMLDAPHMKNEKIIFGVAVVAQR